MKTTSNRIYMFLMLLFMFGYASYSNIIARATSGNARYIMLGATIFFALLASSNNNLLVKLPSKVPFYILLWLLMCVFVLLGIKRLTFGSLQIVTCILVVFISGNSDKWVDIAVNISKFMLAIFVFFTFFFFFFPGLYNNVINFYGFIPDGTFRGAYPYRAGISSHYSINALNISLIFIITAIRYISKNGITLKIPKEERVNFIICIVSFFSLLMTTKRGVLVWSVLAVGIVYIIINKGNVGNIVKIAIVVLVALGILNIFAENSQIINSVFQRFRVVGTENDASSAQRIVMWKLALTYFKKNPIFGIGFWQYRSLYNENLSSIYSTSGMHTSIDAHNVYIQVLCETGIVGFLIYISAVVLLFYRTIVLYRNTDETNVKVKYLIGLSLGLQLFYMLYSFSGNCFYDMTFFYYAFAMGITYSLENTYKYKKQNVPKETVRERYSNTEETVREIFYENSNLNLS